MRKFPLLAAFILFLLLAQLSAPGQPRAETLHFVTQEFAPFSYLEDGYVAGPIKDAIQRVCLEAGLDCGFEVLPWPRAQHKVQVGEAQGLFVVGKTTERLSWLEFSPPLVSSRYGVFVHLDDPLIFRSISDLIGYTVGVYGPSATYEALLEIQEKLEGKLRIEVRPDDIQGFLKLDTRRVNAVFSNRDVGFSIIRSEKLNNIRYAGDYRQTYYYVALSRDHVSKEVRHNFFSAFNDLIRKGELQKIITAYGLDPIIRPESGQ